MFPHIQPNLCLFSVCFTVHCYFYVRILFYSLFFIFIDDIFLVCVCVFVEMFCASVDFHCCLAFNMELKIQHIYVIRVYMQGYF